MYLHKLTNPDFFPFFFPLGKILGTKRGKNENLQKISGNCAPGSYSKLLSLAFHQQLKT